MALRLPSARALLIGALALAVPGVPYAYARSQRLEVEHRAATVASAMTNRSIHVKCPGPIRKRFMYEIHEGSVWFDADGVPVSETKLSADTCDGLREALDHAPALQLACLTGGACPGAEERVAQALAVLAHEIVHLRGVRDEAITECHARGRVASVAAAFGIDPAGGERIARWQTVTWSQELPPQYRGAC
ncbi:hypothetical protein [Baekduia sp. Peel2402]|uniref:hypothetical protein n=1 Tax=Baekduia sp. Peel2402 TaxID=3458296 RepID=UPI00403E5957